MKALILFVMLLGNNNDVHNLIIYDNCDLVELNHCYDEAGKHVFDQIIWYNWTMKWNFDPIFPEVTHWGRGYDVVTYRIVKGEGIIPRYDHQLKRYVQRWWDGKVLREVKCKAFRETWTQYDPELLERTLTKKELRLELTRPMSVTDAQ